MAIQLSSLSNYSMISPSLAPTWFNESFSFPPIVSTIPTNDNNTIYDQGDYDELFDNMITVSHYLYTAIVWIIGLCGNLILLYFCKLFCTALICRRNIGLAAPSQPEDILDDEQRKRIRSNIIDSILIDKVVDENLFEYDEETNSYLLVHRKEKNNSNDDENENESSNKDQEENNNDESVSGKKDQNGNSNKDIDNGSSKDFEYDEETNSSLLTHQKEENNSNNDENGNSNKDQRGNNNVDDGNGSSKTQSESDSSINNDDTNINDTNNNNADGTCSICLEKFKKDDTVIINDCSHVFHKGCLVEWALRRDGCPMCRQDMWDQDKYQKLKEKEILKEANKKSEKRSP